MKKRRHRNHRNIPFEVFNYFGKYGNVKETAHRFNISEDAVLSIVNSYSDDHVVVSNKKENEISMQQSVDEIAENVDKAIDSVGELIKNLHADHAIYTSEPQCGIWCKTKQFFKKILFLS